jgi:phage gp46-like protein
MAWDAAISENGDLVFAANRDLAGVSGIDLIEQRMKTRLKIPRGTWLYDQREDFGSSLHTISNMRPDFIATAAKGYALEALRPMTEIDVSDVQIDQSKREITLTVFYTVNDDDDEEPETQMLEASLPVSELAGSTATTEG